jgi:hypothetical protein
MSSEAPKMRGRRRCTGWTDDETEAFLDIWNDMNARGSKIEQHRHLQGNFKGAL